jgi:hypothetical protein
MNSYAIVSYEGVRQDDKEVYVMENKSAEFLTITGEWKEWLENDRTQFLFGSRFVAYIALKAKLKGEKARVDFLPSGG